MKRMVLFAGVLFVTGTPLALGKPPVQAELSQPQGKERTPLEREFFVPDPGPSRSESGLPALPPRRTSKPDDGQEWVISFNWLQNYRMPLGLAERGIWVSW